MGQFLGPASILRSPTVQGSALLALAIGIAFSVRGGTASNNYVDCKKEYVVCSATGGLASYNYCNWREPVDDAGSGSLIDNIFYTVGPSPNIIGVDATVGPSATDSGSIAVHANLTNFQTSSGAYALFSTGSVKVNSGSYLRLVTLTNPGSGHRATLEFDYCTLLSKR